MTSSYQVRTYCESKKVYLINLNIVFRRWFQFAWRFGFGRFGSSSSSSFGPAMFVWSRPARLESQRGGIILFYTISFDCSVDIPNTFQVISTSNFSKSFFLFFVIHFFYFLFRSTNLLSTVFSHFNSPFDLFSMERNLNPT